jgi:hypothetical protein
VVAQELPYGVPFVLTYGVSDERLQRTRFAPGDRWQFRNTFRAVGSPDLDCAPLNSAVGRQPAALLSCSNHRLDGGAFEWRCVLM